MLSLYIHIPFCTTKCNYCSFQVCPIDKIKPEFQENLFDDYTQSIIDEVKDFSDILDDKELKTIYFWWGTPTLIGKENIIKIVDEIINNFDMENFEEFSIECNPYPQDEIYDMIKTLNKRYKNFPRIRFSFGIQSFDNKVLLSTGRESSFPGLVEFIRGLRPLKLDNNIFNLDFIAFWKLKKLKNENLQLRNSNTIEFFENLLHSHFIDSLSLYTLELFPWSIWYHNNKYKKEWIFWNDDEIYMEFDILKNMIFEHWYKRYEISNFSLPGKSSIHNRIYREHWNYIWLGTSAASFFQSPNKELCKYLNIPEKTKAVRWKNKESLESYQNNKRISEEETSILSNKELLIEKFFLWLRTDNGIWNIEEFEPVLQENYQKMIDNMIKKWFISNNKNKLILTDQGLDIYNYIITELLKEI